jgi:glycosyltransferase involved in cell wall biosynthesis
MSTGLPVIGTDVGDTAEVIGPCGIVVPPRDRERLALAISEIASLSLADRAALGAAARERVRVRFTIERVASQYARLYRDIVNERRGCREAVSDQPREASTALGAKAAGSEPVAAS